MKNELLENELKEVARTIDLYRELHGSDVNTNCIITEIMTKPMFENKTRGIVAEAVGMIIMLINLKNEVNKQDI